MDKKKVIARDIGDTLLALEVVLSGLSSLGLKTISQEAINHIGIMEKYVSTHQAEIHAFIDNHPEFNS